ncbi:MAG: hypothetical protein ACI9PP_000271 [Halobacteriales archaeon]|jgi:hypothetical protein
MADSCGLVVDGPSSYVVTEAGMAYLDDTAPQTESEGQIVHRPND